MLNRSASVKRGVAVASAICCILLAGCVARAADKSDVETVKRKIYDSLLPAGSGELKRVKTYMASLKPDGAWPDVDYNNRTRAGWKTSAHVHRILQMARAYRTPGQALFSDATLKARTLKALDHWLAGRYRNSNNWWNSIGIPRLLGRAAILMESELSPAQVDGIVDIMKRSHYDMTGQNLVWVCEVHSMWACLRNNPAEIGRRLKMISREIRISAGEGLKADHSFYQHGNVLYSGGYGRGFSLDSARWAYFADGTAFAFPEEKMDILAAYILEGQRWMIRGQTFDFGARGREIVRRMGPRARRGQGLASACDFMLKMQDCPRKAEFRAFGEQLRGGSKNTASGNRHFWKADMMTHHRAGYYVSARMTSSRVQNTDYVCNGEGLLSHHIADGVTCIMRTGWEYDNIFPVWDWCKIPGSTVEQIGMKALAGMQVHRKGQRGFVGGVSDGEFGVAAMDFARGALTARKAWFFFDKEVVCLGTGISCSSKNPVVTCVNQCLLEGEVVVPRNGSLSQGERRLQGPVWVHHDGIGYVFPTKAALVLRNAAQTGSWKRINQSRPGTAVSLDVFMLLLDHGSKPSGASYCYVIVPGIGAERLGTYGKADAPEVLQNTAAVQAVRHRGLEMVQAAFYTAGSLVGADELKITVDQPCLVLLREDGKTLRVAVSNPRNRALAVHVAGSWKGTPFQRKFVLPRGEEAGKSVLMSGPLRP